VNAPLVVALGEEQLSELAAQIAARLQEPEPDRWLNTREAAAHLGMHADTLRGLAAQRRIPSVQDRPGCKLHFKRSELDAYRAGIVAPSGPDPSSRTVSHASRGHDRGESPRRVRSRERGRS
jgi:excisionase family DNA binding protein